MSIGENIKRKRLEKGYTLEDLAQLVKTSKQTVHRYENSIISNIPSDKIEMLAAALDTTPAYLMGWEDDPAPASEKTAAQNSPEIDRLISTAKKLSSEKLNTLIQVAESML